MGSRVTWKAATLNEEAIAATCNRWRTGTLPRLSLGIVRITQKWAAIWAGRPMCTWGGRTLLLSTSDLKPPSVEAAGKGSHAGHIPLVPKKEEGQKD